MRFFTLLFLFVTLLNPAAFAAQDDPLLSLERIQIRLRTLAVLPDDDSSVNIGGEVDIGDAIVPELDITYFFTDHMAAELVLGTAQHEAYYNGSTNLGNVWVLPPTLTLQYHFMPDHSFSPYLGAGVNYSLFYGEESGDGFTDFEVDGGFGLAAQAGFDYWLNDNWGLNLDVKKIWLDVDASLNNKSITADIELDPWLIGAGVSYRF